MLLVTGQAWGARSRWAAWRPPTDFEHQVVILDVSVGRDGLTRERKIEDGRRERRMGWRERERGVGREGSEGGTEG